MPRRVRRASTAAGQAGALRARKQYGQAGVQITWENQLTLNHEDIASSVGLLATGIILLRTSRGIDWQGRTFKPYSEEYRKTRIRRGLTPNLVDLRVTGSMLGSVGPKRNDMGSDRVRVIVAPGADRDARGLPNNLKARYNEQLGRVFLRLTKLEMQTIWRHTPSAAKLKQTRG